MTMRYNPERLREYAALSNSPIIYCLTYETDSHRVAGVWAYQWLINFVQTSDPVAFHPHALKLIKENLPKWRSPLVAVDDYHLFLDGANRGGDVRLLDALIQQAIEQNRVLYLDKSRWVWEVTLPSN